MLPLRRKGKWRKRVWVRGKERGNFQELKRQSKTFQINVVKKKKRSESESRVKKFFDTVQYSLRKQGHLGKAGYNEVKNGGCVCGILSIVN